MRATAALEGLALVIDGVDHNPDGNQANAVMQIRAGLPDDPFLDFLEGGLREARFYKGRDEATMDRIVEAAVEEHGSIIAAMRAGALS